MHQSTVRLSRHLEVRREAVSARQWAVAVAESQPALADSVAELASGWVQPAESSVRHSGAVALHKDFHPGHVLLSDGAVWAIDLDEARHGPAVFDLAHFCTYLSAEGDPGGRRRAAFLREYADAMGQPTVIDSQDASFAAWSAYTWLKIAKQRALSSGPWRGGSVDQQHPVADAVAQGLACLAR
jgi:aminoglycoside phosphotransferase (APT) family kinase protein